jgi:hypothetical protein
MKSNLGCACDGDCKVVAFLTAYAADEWEWNTEL